MKKKIPKTQIKEEIKKFFSDIQTRTPKEIKKIKKLARNYRICMKDHKKTFCKKCFTTYNSPKIRIKNKIKSVTCKNCGYTTKYKINFS